MKLGIGTYSHMWSIGFQGAQPEEPLTAAGLLEEAARLGVEVVQFGPNLGLQSLPDDERRDVVARARELHLELEAGTKGLEHSHLIDMAKLARSCGAQLLRSVPAETPSGTPPSAADIEVALRAALPAFEGEGVVLAIENALIPAQVLKCVVETIGSPMVGITLDTVNSMAISEGVREVAETLAPYTRCLHVKDFDVTRAWHMMGFQVQGRPAGLGQLDLPWMLDLLKSHDADPNAILELWVPEQATLAATIAMERQWVSGSIAYLRTLIPSRI